MRKILFLDIDGVVNSAQFASTQRGPLGIDPYPAFLVGKIQLDTGCEVVLSSTWRLWEDGCKDVAEQVVEFVDTTPDLRGKARGYEIQDWLDRHKDVVVYAILDDNTDMLVGQAKNFFKTDWSEGLTPEIAKAVTDHLNSDLVYKHKECDKAITEGRTEGACVGCVEHIFGDRI